MILRESQDAVLLVGLAHGPDRVDPAPSSSPQAKEDCEGDEGDGDQCAHDATRNGSRV